MRKIELFFLSLCIVFLYLTACTGAERREYTFFGAFDTGITVIAYTKSESEFASLCSMAENEFMRLHRLFDIYENYEQNNIKSINDNAGVSPVNVSKEIIDLLLFSREMYEISGGRLNVLMGSVLSVWHEYRENGIADEKNAELPDIDGLRLAAEHCGMEALVIDPDGGTVFITDSYASLDVGAVAKGFACGIVADMLESEGFDSVLINAGGNICTVGKKPSGELWSIGVQSPLEPTKNIAVRENVSGSAATSGDYQRFYTVDGVNYSHIIDGETLFPAEYMHSVTVFADESLGVMGSAYADAYSTVFFLMPPEQALALCEQMDGIEIFIVCLDGTTIKSKGW